MNPYDDLSDDNSIAFLQLEREFRSHFEAEMEQGNNWEWYAPDYMNKVLAAATQFEIEALAVYKVPYGSKLDHDHFTSFQRDVDNVIVQLRIMHSRRIGRMKVGFSEDQKSRMHAYVEKMRVEVEHSQASPSKKDAVFKILAELASEISRDRSRYDRFADLARSLAGLSREVAEDGAEPWWKWFRLAAGVVDDAKEAEPKITREPDLKRLEPPRKQLPKASRNSSDDTDDEIPF